MATVWVHNDSDWASSGAGGMTPDYVTDDLAAWLAALSPPTADDGPDDWRGQQRRSQ